MYRILRNPSSSSSGEVKNRSVKFLCKREKASFNTLLSSTSLAEGSRITVAVLLVVVAVELVVAELLELAVVEPFAQS